MSDDSIKEAVRKLAGTHLQDSIHLITATVNEVDQLSRTALCTPIKGAAPTQITAYFMTEVDDGVMFIPTVGSTVLIISSTQNLPYIIQYSGLDKIFLVALLGIQFNGGEFGGIPIAQALATAFNLIIDAFNLLNTKVNTLAPTPVIPPLVDVVVTDLENQNITHGY